MTNSTFVPVARPDLTNAYTGWTKQQLADKLAQLFNTSHTGGAAYYKRAFTRPQLIEQFELHEWYAATKAALNADMGVRMATGGLNHPQHHTCGVCTRWIGHLGQLWAWRGPAQHMGKRGMVQTTASNWNHIEAFCLECASS